MNPGSISIVCTAWRRPEYLQETLASWSRVRGISEVRRFTIALGWSDQATLEKQTEVIDAAKRPPDPLPMLRVKPDSSAARAARGMGRAIGEAITDAFRDPGTQFVIAGEEDVVVSDDVLEYMSWAASEFKADPRVLIACAHTPAGQGFDEPGAGLREDPDADPEVVRLIPRFSPWVWGVWRDRWERAIRPRWDWACDTATRPDGTDAGYDWHLATRIIPQGGYVCAVPLASRSQNIGRDGGWAADPAQFEGTQAASFRPERGACAYRVVAEPEQLPAVA